MKVKHLLITLAVVITAATVVSYFALRSESGGELKFISEIKGEGSNTLKDPSFAISDNSGKIYIADSGNSRIAVFTDKGKFVRAIGGSDSKKPLQYPYGIGVLDKDKLIVADTAAGTVSEFTTNGDYVRTWLDRDANVRPTMVFITSRNKVYVSDTVGKQILVFSEKGELLDRVKAEIEISAPMGIAVDVDGSIWVADGSNYNIKHMTNEGRNLDVFDGGPNNPLAMAKGLAVDSKDRVYVADTMNNSIRIFDNKGENFSTSGQGNSSINLPNGLSIDTKDKLYIADQGNNKIQIWAWK